MYIYNIIQLIFKYRKFQFKIVALGLKLYLVNPAYIKCKRNK